MQVEIDFNFVGTHENDDIDNNTQNLIRQYIVEMLRNSEFGEIINDDEFILINTYIRPFVVGYVGDGQHEMFFGYLFNISNDTSRGNLGILLTQGIPNLYTVMNNQHPDIRTYIRTTYIN